MSGRRPGRSRAWSAVFRASYAVIRLAGAIVNALIRRGAPFTGAFATLELAGRRSGRPRPIPVTLLTLEGRWYVGHPDGAAGWTANLAAAATVRLIRSGAAAVVVRAVLLPDGAERTAVIRATARLQPFPASLLYRAARAHILAAGTYYRLAPDQPDPAGPPATPEEPR